MFDIGWSEMGVIALVALIVLGPKELPGALRTFAYWAKQIRSLAREFQSGVDQLIREAELDEARKKLEEASRINVGREIEKMVDPDRSLQAALKPPADTPQPATTTGGGSTGSAAAPVNGTAEPAVVSAASSAEVTPFPSPAGAAAPQADGAASEDGVATGVAVAAVAGVSETDDVAEVAASRQAHG